MIAEALLMATTVWYIVEEMAKSFEKVKGQVEGSPVRDFSFDLADR